MNSPSIDLAVSLSTLFQPDKPLALVVGPDAYVYRRLDADRISHSGMEIDPVTLYDTWIDHLLSDPSAHESHDLFLATELWMKNKGLASATSHLADEQRIFFSDRTEDNFPVLDLVASLPFKYYVNFGFDPYLYNAVAKIRPQARLFSIGIDDLESRWKKADSATITSPWIINILGTAGGESITTYSDLADLFTEILQAEFLHNKMRSELNNGRILFLGMQLRHWYTRVLLLALRSDVVRGRGRRRAVEFRAPMLASEEACISMYSESTSGIEMQVTGCSEILEVLERLKEMHGIKSAFVSYRFSELDRLIPIKTLLEEEGLVVNTSADFEVSAGEEWEEIRTKAIVQSDLFVALVTESVRNDRTSDCWTERDIALANEVTTVPIVFDGLSLDQVWGDRDDAKSIQPLTSDNVNLSDILRQRVRVA